MMIKDEPFKEAFFFDDSIEFRKEIRMPLAFVGGLNSLDSINKVLNAGFEFVEMARPLVYDMHRKRLPPRQLLRGPHLELRHAVPRELSALPPYETRGGAQH